MNSVVSQIVHFTAKDFESSETSELRKAVQNIKQEINRRETTCATCVLMVNLPFKIKYEDIRNFFKDVGKPTNIQYINVSKSNMFTGTARVTFATAEEARAATTKHGCELLGDTIGIDFAPEEDPAAKLPKKLAIKENQWGNYEDPDTGVVFEELPVAVRNKKMPVAIGTQDREAPTTKTKRSSIVPL